MTQVLELLSDPLRPFPSNISSCKNGCEMLTKLTRGTSGGLKEPIVKIIGGNRGEKGATDDSKRRAEQPSRARPWFMLSPL